VYSVILAYMLWFLSGFGALGLHRFYLGKIGTGLIWLFTGGLGMVGGIFDFFALPNMVRERNLSLGYARPEVPRVGAPPPPPRPVKKESLERIVLKTAERSGGVVTPTKVALAADIGLDEAKDFLEKLSSKGFAEMRIKRSGAIVYCFPEFMDGEADDYEDL